MYLITNKRGTTTFFLDTESEIALQKAIDTLVKNKTVIVIAHRLSTIVAANQKPTLTLKQETLAIVSGGEKQRISIAWR